MLDGLALFRLLLILWPKISMDRELNHHPPNKLLFRRMALVSGWHAQIENAVVLPFILH